MRQVAVLEQAAELVRTAIDDITSTINPDEAAWRDVSRHAHLVDRVRSLVIEE